MVFGDRDVEALQTIASIVEKGVVRPESEASVARSLGQVMARLADWQTSLLSDFDSLEDVPDDLTEATVQVAGELVPLIEQLQSYVWRRPWWPRPPASSRWPRTTLRRTPWSPASRTSSGSPR